MLINLRNALMAGKRLPYQCELEYLEGTGTQWIDTGVAAFNWPYIEITCKVNGTYTKDYASGIIGNSNGGSRWQGIAPSGTTGVFFRGYNNATTISESVTADFITLVFDGPNRTAYAGQSSATLLSGNQAGARYGIWAYVGRVSPIAMSVASVRIGTSRDNLLFDAIPVRKGTVGYLYDRVSGALFGNAGTGDFVLGPDVVPVEWLGSSGTQYIDIPVSTAAGQYFGVKGKVIVSDTYASTTTNYYRRVIDSDVPNGFCAVAYSYATETNLMTYATTVGNISASGGLIIPAHTLTDFELSTAGRTQYGEFVPLSRPLTTPLSTLRLYGKLASSGSATFGSIAFASIDVASGDSSLYKFRPVRVGTGSTWEGAMMDVLTRRIYRNAGTGAFTYGNDLKYPIPAS